MASTLTRFKCIHSIRDEWGRVEGVGGPFLAHPNTRGNRKNQNIFKKEEEKSFLTLYRTETFFLTEDRPKTTIYKAQQHHPIENLSNNNNR